MKPDGKKIRVNIVIVAYHKEVCAVDKDFDRFLGSEVHGEYRAALVLLAINTGYPVVSTRLLRLIDGCEDETSWSAFLKNIDPGTPVQKRRKWAKDLTWTPAKQKALKKILAHLKELETNYGMPDDLKAYKDWAKEVGRYAFHWHLPVSKEGTAHEFISLK